MVPAARWAIVLASLLVVPVVAYAEPQACVITGVAPLGYSCGGAPCLADVDCAPVTFFGEPVCGLPIGDFRYCRARCGTIILCASDADCPSSPATPAECAPQSISAGLPGICLFRSLGVDYCVVGAGAVDRTAFEACHTTVGGLATSDYFEGNCDGDACANGRDPDPCAADSRPCAASGATLCSAVSAMDGGVVSVGDAGADAAIDDDASVATSDAGEALDAGADDAAVTPPVDAGAFDAGRMDAGARVLGAADALTFRGSGGCVCGVAGARMRGPARESLALLAACVLTLRLRARRRASAATVAA